METNSQSALDLYARIEDLLGVKEAAPDLYAHYLLALQSNPFESLLDVGCGSGDFIASIHGAFSDAAFRGIDLSPHMIALAQEKKIEASVEDLCEIDEKYDAITAVFDVLNYLNETELKRFGKCLRDALNDRGVFLCDVNTLYGFEEVAVGVFSAEDSHRFVNIEGDFDAGVYRSDFTLFEENSEGCWGKYSETIRQYYYTIDKLEAHLGLQLVSQSPVQIYGDKTDKTFIIFKKK